MNNRIKELQAEIERERRKIASCKHEYGKPFYNPEKVKEAYGYKPVAHGSDVWGEPEGYRDVDKPRWTRVCIHCGNEDHTDKQKAVVVGHEPDFGK